MQASKPAQGIADTVSQELGSMTYYHLSPLLAGLIALPRFAGLGLGGRWGLSSEVEIPSLQFYDAMMSKGASIAFTPTIAARDPLSEEARGKCYTKFYLLSSRGGVSVLSRPLSNKVEKVVELTENLERGEGKVVLSIAAESFENALSILEKFRGIIDGVELDISISCLLARKRGRKFSYIVELARELSEVVEVPLLLKLSALGVEVLDLGRLVEEANARALILSPNVVYRVGNHYFRLHSPLTFRVGLLNSIEPLSEVGVDVAYVARSLDVSSRLESMIDVFPLKLYDITLLLEWMGFERAEFEKGVDTPLQWRAIDRRLRIVAAKGARYCPYGALRGDGELVAGEECDYCGMCLELNPPGTVKLAAFIEPE